MAHSIQAFVSRHAAFSRAGLTCPTPVVDLPQELAMLPLTQELWAAIHEGEDPDSLRSRSVGLSRWSDADHTFLARLARGTTAAYVETSYHGGDGEQGAIVDTDSYVFGRIEMLRHATNIYHRKLWNPLPRSVGVSSVLMVRRTLGIE